MKDVVKVERKMQEHRNSIHRFWMATNSTFCDKWSANSIIF